MLHLRHLHCQIHLSTDYPHADCFDGNCVELPPPGPFLCRVNFWVKESIHRPAPLRNLSLPKEHGEPQRKDFGGRYGSFGFYRFLYRPPAWMFFLGGQKSSPKDFPLVVVVWATHRAGESEPRPTSGSTSGTTSGPTSAPTRSPTRAPTTGPTRVDFPVFSPSRTPTKRPTKASTEVPTKVSSRVVEVHP